MADMSNEVRTYEIPSVNLAAFKAAFGRLVRRAERLGVEAPTFTIVGEITRPVYVEVDGPHGPRLAETGEVYLVHQVVVTGSAPRYAGWEFLAAIDLADAANAVEVDGEVLNLVHYAPGVEVVEAYHTLTERCDHCGVDSRGRKTLVAVRHESGETKVVGTSCLRDFLGHRSPDNVAAAAQWLADLDDIGSEFTEFSGGGEIRFDASTYLGLVALAVRLHGWVSKASSGVRNPATVERVADLLAAYRRGDKDAPKVTDDDVAAAEAALAWARALPAVGGNDYLNNVAAVASRATWGSKELGIGASILAAWSREVEREVRKAAEAEATSASEAFGTVGERLVLTGTVTGVSFHEGDYGTRALVKILTDEGNVATWWASSPSKAPKVGQKVTGKATVKRHGEFRGVAETTVTRFAWSALEVAA